MSSSGEKNAKPKKSQLLPPEGSPTVRTSNKPQLYPVPNEIKHRTFEFDPSRYMPGANIKEFKEVQQEKRRMFATYLGGGMLILVWLAALYNQITATTSEERWGMYIITVVLPALLFAVFGWKRKNN